MYSILYSALNGLLGFVFKKAVLQFVIFGVLFLVVSGFVTYLSSKLPTFDGLGSMMANIPSSIWYFLEVFQFPQGFSLCLSSYLTAFCIRRIPIIG